MQNPSMSPDRRPSFSLQSLRATALLAFVLLVASAALVPSCGASSGEPGGSDLRQLIANGALVVDVRTVGEFASGHFPGALHIPVDQIGARLEELGPRDQAIVLYCASGARSGRALRMLESAGYQNVINAGGLRDMPR